MYLYYNKNGELLTIIPHGEPPRQNNFLNLYICLDYDYFDQEIYSNINLGESLSRFKMLVDITKPNKITCVDNLPTKFEYKQFKKTNDSEITFALVNDTSYLTFEFNLQPELSTNLAGEIKVGVKTFVVDDNNAIIDSTMRTFDPAHIFIEKTFTSGRTAPDSTYFQLQRQINLVTTNLILLQNKVERLTEVGIEIDLQDIGYAEPDGDFVAANFEQYCEHFGNGKILVYSFSQEAMQTYPKLWNFIKSCSPNSTNGANSVVISNIYSLIYQVKLVNTANDMISYDYFNNKWNNSGSSAMITTSVYAPAAPEEDDIWYQILE